MSKRRTKIKMGTGQERCHAHGRILEKIQAQEL
jgi:hypothetical protein